MHSAEMKTTQRTSKGSWFKSGGGDIFFKMDFVIIIGFIAAFLTTVSSLPQVLKALKTRKTEDVSFWMFLLLNVGIGFWLVYGLLLNNWPLILANGVGLGLNVAVLFLKIKYG